MAECFNGVSTENTEKFFMNMIVSDINMPHTREKLSPITFCEFMVRNQICVIAPFGIYDEANKIWKKFIKLNGGVFDGHNRKNVDLDQAETKHAGWNLIIDYLNRLIEVEKMNDSPYYQMHYLAHVCHNFYRETEQLDTTKCAAYRTAWNEIVSPILYEPIVPTQYTWLPIENWSDIRFSSDLIKTVANARIFISNHSSSTMKHSEYDNSRVDLLKEAIESTIKRVYSNKYKEAADWMKPVTELVVKSQLIKADAEMCEMWSMFDANGLKLPKILRKLDKFKTRYESGYYTDSPDDVIDDLLDIRPKNEEIPANLDEAIAKELDKVKEEVSNGK